MQTQEQKERDAWQASQVRKSGLDLMPERDRGYGVLHNLDGGEAKMFWHVDYKGEPLEGEVRRHIPKGMFVIEVGKEKLVLDSGEFRKLFRWTD